MTEQPPALWFLFHGKNILLFPGKQGEAALPRMPLAVAEPDRAVRHTLGAHNNTPCFALAVSELPPDADERFVETDLRASHTVLGDELHALAGKGHELVYWDMHSRCCPACGTPTRWKTAISKECLACGDELFPVISVAIIVLIRKGEEALLVRAHNFRGNFYGLVAGFLEPGETLEECVTREVREETNLKVRNIAYFGSQPWPYPSGLMVGFTADYAGGRIKVQKSELRDARFFSRDNVPEMPSKHSIARRLIDCWLAQKC